MSLKTNAYSRMQFTPPTIHKGVEMFGEWVQPNFLTTKLNPDDEITYVVTNDVEGKPHSIAYEIYGTTLLDWVVLAYNAPRSTLNWPKTGDVIKLPRKSLVIPEVT